MYNPYRHAKAQKQRMRKQDPHAGTKHSDIIRKHGVGVGAPIKQVLKRSTHGRFSPIFDCDSFSVRYELFMAGNNSGVGVNPDGDRTIRILRGSLFVTYEDKQGVVVSERIHQGAHLHVPANVKHSYATSGTSDVELLFIETPGYEDGWERLTDATLLCEDASMIMATPTAARTGKRDSTKAKVQAVQSAARKARRVGTKVVSPQDALAASGASAVSVGVNPKPIAIIEE